MMSWMMSPAVGAKQLSAERSMLLYHPASSVLPASTKRLIVLIMVTAKVVEMLYGFSTHPRAAVAGVDI